MNLIVTLIATLFLPSFALAENYGEQARLWVPAAYGTPSAAELNARISAKAKERAQAENAREEAQLRQRDAEIERNGGRSFLDDYTIRAIEGQTGRRIGSAWMQMRRNKKGHWVSDGIEYTDSGFFCKTVGRGRFFPVRGCFSMDGSPIHTGDENQLPYNPYGSRSPWGF